MTDRGEMGVVRLPDGKLYCEWHIYRKEVLNVAKS